MNYKLSIIIPCYNVAPYLRRCLDALLEQAAGPEDLELVCINDGSPDDTLEILHEYRRNYPQQMVVIDQENRGVWDSRRRGIAAARGRYIGFADPDDHVKPGFVKTMYETAVKEDADMVCCGYDRIDAESGRVYSTEMMHFPYPSFDFQREPGLMTEVNSAIWNKIFRAERIKDMPTIRRIPRALDDMLFFLLLCRKAGKIVFVRQSLVAYMVRKGSIINSLRPEDIPEIYAGSRELRGIIAGEQPHLLHFYDAYAFLHLGISLMHRISLSPEGNRVLGRTLRKNEAVLDLCFPGWKHNKYLGFSYVIKRKGANARTSLVHAIYRMHLMIPFLYCYRKMPEKLGIDVKW